MDTKEKNLRTVIMFMTQTVAAGLLALVVFPTMGVFQFLSLIVAINLYIIAALIYKGF